MSRPAKFTKCTLFFEGGQMIGQGEVTLPNIQFQTEEFNSWGTSGSVEMPLRKLQAMESVVRVNAPNGDFFRSSVNPNKTLRIQLFGVFNTVDPVNGNGVIGERAELLLSSKGMNLGSRNQGEGGEFESNFSVLAVGYFANGEEIVFADPINNILRVNGVNEFAQDRALLGL